MYERTFRRSAQSWLYALNAAKPMRSVDTDWSGQPLMTKQKRASSGWRLHPNAAGNSDVTMLYSFFLKPDSGLAA
ncbi:hypothetical protein AB4Z29_31605 [Paenibacillus sp. 2TAB23]|uniref:hypothetical protein n=1 Tax=Paenibacillus sp. 2TAB23 TaxID=3233004 RepID=UPI003F96EF3B